MRLRPLFHLTAFLTLLLVLSGCGSDNAPVNEGKDKPVPAKKDKERA